MLWIKMCENLTDHPKLKKLARLTGISQDEAIGKLFRFWTFVGKYAEDGDLRKFEPEDIDAAVQFPPLGSRVFFDALLASKFIDQEPYLRVHDWYEYVKNFLIKKYSNTDDDDKPQLIKRLYKSRKSSRTGNRTVTGREPYPRSALLFTAVQQPPLPPSQGGDLAAPKPGSENGPGNGGQKAKRTGSRLNGTSPRQIDKAHTEALRHEAKLRRLSEQEKEHAADTAADMTDAERDESLRRNAPNLWIRKHQRMGHRVDVERMVILDEMAAVVELATAGG